jgi:L-lysine exporter family protein LysE/ArgO
MPIVLRNILLGISLAAPIGPAGVAVIQGGLRGGFWRAFATGLGVTLADTTYLLLVFFGLASFISIPAVKVLVWLFGAGVLIYLGVASILSARRGVDIPAVPALEGKALPERNPFLTGYLVNISNPLAIVFWVGIYGSLLGTSMGGESRLQALLLSASILVGILIWHTTASVLSHWGRRFLNAGWIKGISIAAGVILILFGVRFGAYATILLFG